MGITLLLGAIRFAGGVAVEDKTGNGHGRTGRENADARSKFSDGSRLKSPIVRQKGAALWQIILEVILE